MKIKLPKDISNKILNIDEWDFSDMKNSYHFDTKNHKIWISIHKRGGYFVNGKEVIFPFWTGIKIKQKLWSIIKNNKSSQNWTYENEFLKKLRKLLK